MLSKLFSKFSQKESDKSKRQVNNKNVHTEKTKITSNRIGDLGEYKINIQLDQLPKNSKYLSDILIPNPKAKSGYSQIDHVVFTPFAVFVIETKNYAGTIYGDRMRAKWSVNGKFPMLNPFNQNYGHILAIKSIINELDDSNVVSIVSFTRRSTFKVNEELRKIQSNDLIVYDIELSEFINRKINVLKLQHKSEIYTEREILYMYNELSQANITDSEIRQKHVQLLKKNRDVDKSENKKTGAVCKTCGKEVSEKVKQFCLSNENRFNGNVYCYEHQKR
ncbi:nuclease-related domain-containing protein [Heyndrickxia camelliae]|uniref:NERD nuclease n=1 Tax=Heyndrickxia camelliae TaxID=1707093 RepID=A0A2N3LQA4_9BACI|nr:nuclease-related domain-containing protein [Heyndrickxia camelliae]PKR86806.1 NERD nuclease [Heyndrickxia camelliae]